VDHAGLMADEDLDLAAELILNLAKVPIDEVNDARWCHLNFEHLLLLQ
jgi:hypothetical protein